MGQEMRSDEIGKHQANPDQHYFPRNSHFLVLSGSRGFWLEEYTHVFVICQELSQIFFYTRKKVTRGTGCSRPIVFHEISLFSLPNLLEMAILE